MSDTKEKPRDVTVPNPFDQAARVLFRLLAIFEGFTWVGLIVAMVIKYPLHGSPVWVATFGQLHGVTWIAFVVGCVAVGIWFRWTWTTTLVGIIASLVPFATIPFDLWIERSGRVNSRRIW